MIPHFEGRMSYAGGNPNFNGPLRFAFETWLYRYGTRRGAINSMLLADRQVLVKRNSSIWNATPFVPAEQFLSILTDLHTSYEKQFIYVNYPEYGPPLHWFPLKAQQHGIDAAQMCQMMWKWALRRPSAMEEWERRAGLRPRRYEFNAIFGALAPYLDVPVTWFHNDDLDVPWVTKHEGRLTSPQRLPRRVPLHPDH